MGIMFDSKEFPLIKIELNENLNNYDEFKNNLLDKWLELYKKKEYFELEFETKNLNYVNIIYSFYMAVFIRKIKKQKPQYLQKSKIYIYNRYIFRLAKLIFEIEKPVALVELILIKDNIEINKEIVLP